MKAIRSIIILGALLIAGAAGAQGFGPSLFTCDIGSQSCITSASPTYNVNSATGDYSIQLGTDTSATDFNVVNNSGSEIWVVGGDGKVTMTAGFTNTSAVFGTGNLSLAPVNCATTVGAESADVIAVTIACVDADGVALTTPITLSADLYESTALTAYAAEDTLDENGAGAALEGGGDTGANMILVTSATGTATVEVTDQGGASGATRVLEVRGDMGPSTGRVVIGTRDNIVFD